MKTLGKLLAPLVLTTAALSFTLGTVQGAHATPTARTGYRATVICSHMSEDTAAHVHLTRYHVKPDGTIVIVYHCGHQF